MPRNSPENGPAASTAGPNSDQQWPVLKSKFEGQKLKFEVQTDDGGLLVFDLTFDGDSIRGTCAGTGNGGEKMSAKVDLKKVT